jgi:hypothetical protein
MSLAESARLVLAYTVGKETHLLSQRRAAPFSRAEQEQTGAMPDG